MFVAPPLLVQGSERNQPSQSASGPQVIDRRLNQRPRRRQQIRGWTTTSIHPVSKSRGRVLAAQRSKKGGAWLHQAVQAVWVAHGSSVSSLNLQSGFAFVVVGTNGRPACWCMIHPTYTWGQRATYGCLSSIAPSRSCCPCRRSHPAAALLPALSPVCVLHQQFGRARL